MVMFNRGGARSDRDLNCQSADANGSSAAAKAQVCKALIVDRIEID